MLPDSLSSSRNLIFGPNPSICSLLCPQKINVDNIIYRRWPFAIPRNLHWKIGGLIWTTYQRTILFTYFKKGLDVFLTERSVGRGLENHIYETSLSKSRHKTPWCAILRCIAMNYVHCLIPKWDQYVFLCLLLPYSTTNIYIWIIWLIHAHGMSNSQRVALILSSSVVWKE